MTDLGKKDIRSWSRLLRVHAAVTGLIDDRLKAAGLPPAAWYAFLVELDKAGDDGLRPFELEQVTHEAQYAVSRLLDRMIKARAVRRAPCPDDRRGWRVALTDEGRAIKARMWDIYSTALADRFVDRLSGKQVRLLDDILGDLLDRAVKKRG